MATITYKKKYEALLQENELLKEQLAGMELKVKFYDVVLAAKGAIPLNRIAACYGLTAQGVHKMLEEDKILYKKQDKWWIHSKYAAKGYYAEKAAIFTDSDGETYVKFSGVWTPKGQAFLHTYLQGKGYEMINADEEGESQQ